MVGTYTLMPTVANEAVEEAPFALHVSAGAFDPTLTSVDVPRPGQVGRHGPRVAVRDAHGNLRAGCDDEVEADLTPVLKLAGLKARSDGNGVYAVDYPPNLLPGRYDVDVRVNGAVVPSGPFTADVEPLALSDEHAQAVDEVVPGVASLLKRLLSHTTEAERSAVVAALRGLHAV